MRVILWRRPKVAGSLWNFLKIALITSLIVTFVVPVRNILLSSIIPEMWKEHSTFFLLKIMLDSQYIEVASDDTLQNLSQVKVNISTVDIQGKFASHPQKFQAYYDRVALLQTLSASNSEAKTELEQLLTFKPGMSEHERAIALFTLDVFVKACEAANFTYFLISGSALGAIRHHGMIPWDDDFDIVMSSSQGRMISSVLGNVQEFELFSPAKVQWKFYMKSLPQGNRPFKWPNIDIFFYNEDETHIWAQTPGAKISLCNKKSDIFPLVRRKFEKWYLPVPRKLKVIMASEFGNYHSACKTAYYNHKTNVEVTGNSLISINCEKLYSVFPFVFHETNKHGVKIEVCRIGDQIVGNISVSIDL